ncbi:uncharacterized protein LOC141791203 [Halichoeres trimaculatus]|uniref:uncharacterized protein LOC141791203 n=1 Tax=Halichoeres trimaculatus TaxID=147232 RepID=UPI003D9DB43D
MFIKNFDLRHPRRHYELFQPSRPYRGEPPTLAGFLLYPDTPAKMETTSHDAFCFQPTIQHNQGKGDSDAQNTQRASHHSLSTALTQTGRGNNSRGRGTREDERDHTAVKKEQHTLEMLSQYQKDFPPLASCRRRTPALPQPDNIGINPAFRIEFNTVQRETYPGWPIMNSRCAGRIKAASSGHRSVTSEH